MEWKQVSFPVFVDVMMLQSLTQRLVLSFMSLAVSERRCRGDFMKEISDAHLKHTLTEIQQRSKLFWWCRDVALLIKCLLIFICMKVYLISPSWNIYDVTKKWLITCSIMMIQEHQHEDITWCREWSLSGCGADDLVKNYSVSLCSNFHILVVQNQQ